MTRKPYPTDLTDAQWAIIEEGGDPQRRHFGQPNRQDDGKRRPTGYDAAKKVKGRKRTLVVDTLGMILDLWVHPADVQDYDAGKELLAAIPEWYPRLEKFWADGQFGKNGLPAWALAELGLILEIVQRAEGTKGFVVQAKRWIVERTLGWLNGYRRLSKDYEATTESSETMIYLAMIDLMVTRLAPTQPFP